jgi:Holliday junction DNA helicase RuvA
MIARLQGEAVERSPGRLVLDVGRVGYEVLISLNTFGALPAAGPVSLHIYTHARESEMTLFGFADLREKGLFRQLQTVAGIGPRLALGIVSQMPAPDLAAVIRQRDVARLVALPGIGKRTAERIITELSEKMAALEAGAPSAPAAGGAIRADARLALLNLGYREPAVERALDQVLAAPGRHTAVPLEDVLRQCLRVLSGV